MNELECLPCPFCGSKIDVEDLDTLYPSGTGWEDTDEGYRHYVSIYDVPREQWCYKIVCQEHYGGCGAEIHGDSIPEVKEKWNKRVANKLIVTVADKLKMAEEVGLKLPHATNTNNPIDFPQVTKYKCPECSWIGTERDMDADYVTYEDEEGFGDEVWSNWICPSCGTWHQLEDYEEVKE